MNYCSPKWINDGKLTETDIYGIQRAYYAEYFNSECDIPVTPVERDAVKSYNVTKNPAILENRATRTVPVTPPVSVLHQAGTTSKSVK